MEKYKYSVDDSDFIEITSNSLKEAINYIILTVKNYTQIIVCDLNPMQYNNQFMKFKILKENQ